MTEFCLSLAGIPIKAACIHESTRDFCREFLCDAEPQVNISLTQSDIDREREKSRLEDALEGRGVRQYSGEYLETLALYRNIAAALIERDIILFHGSALEVDGEAYIFTAKSGTGKTTHTRLWQKLLGERMSIVNGDKPLLKFTPEAILACGTPWRGKEGYGGTGIVPVKAVCILERAKENSIERISYPEAFPTLLRQTNRPEDTALMKKTLSLLSRLGSETKLYRLRCSMDISAAETAYEGMR